MKTANRPSSIDHRHCINRGPGPRFDFGPQHPVVEIRRVIEGHVGAAQAITIEGIAEEIWAEDWWLIVQGPHHCPIYPHRPKIQRAIKKAVRGLRRQGLKIASSRGSAGLPGYYMIETRRELVNTVRPLIRQAVDQLRTVEALTGRDFFTRELAGQQKLFTTETTENAETR